jgi:tetratricopeptide (TPR) repeat protein
MLSSADPGARGRDVTIAQVLGEAANRLPTQFANEPETAASLRSTIGMTYFGLGLFDDAEPLLRNALAERRRLLGPTHPDVASSMNDLAQLLAERGSLPEAEKLYRDALEISRKTRESVTLDTASLMQPRSPALVEGDLDAAEQMHRDALGFAARLLCVNADVAQSLNDLG